MSFDKLNNVLLSQTLCLKLNNMTVEIPLFHPQVIWKNKKYCWNNDIFGYKEWNITNKKKNQRELKQFILKRLVWHTKQVISSYKNGILIVKEYDLLNNNKLIGIVKYTKVAKNYK
jgi:hypothetical protein